MAIDTAEKRYSMIAFGDGSAPLFEPDSTVDADDMYHLIGLYSGITLDNPTAPTFKPGFIRATRTQSMQGMS